MSFNNFDDNRTKEQDLRLFDYLVKNKHSTPVEMVEVYLEMKLPIFVARQFVRHRTATINEVSARYVKLPNEFYIPEVVGGKPTSGAKQGQEDSLAKDFQTLFRIDLIQACESSYANYEYYLEQGVAPEHARLFLHVNHYTHWIWKQDLHNLSHFLGLRLDSHAQVEARAYAMAIYSLLEAQIPNLMRLIAENRNFPV
jgi:thymidylate synthase (FAD)